jgi:hypothetical protein
MLKFLSAGFVLALALFEPQGKKDLDANKNYFCTSAKLVGSTTRWFHVLFMTNKHARVLQREKIKIYIST